MGLVAFGNVLNPEAGKMSLHKDYQTLPQPSPRKEAFDQDQSRRSRSPVFSPHHLKGENDMTSFEQTYLITVLACFGAFAIVLGLTDLSTRSARK